MKRCRAGRAIPPAEKIGAQDADTLGLKGPTLAAQWLPPVAGRVRRTSERVDDEDLRRLVGRWAVVPVGDGQIGERRPAPQRERPQRRRLGAAGPGGETGRPGAATPPSSAATRSSNTAVVGFMIRV